MRIVLLMVLLSSSVYAQNPIHSEPTPALLYRPVVHAMWDRDEGEHAYPTADGFIKIAVHPALDPEFFVDVRLNKT